MRRPAGRPARTAVRPPMRAACAGMDGVERFGDATGTDPREAVALGGQGEGRAEHRAPAGATEFRGPIAPDVTAPGPDRSIPDGDEGSAGAEMRPLAAPALGSAERGRGVPAM